MIRTVRRNPPYRPDPHPSDGSSETGYPSPLEPMARRCRGRCVCVIVDAGHSFLRPVCRGKPT